MTDRAARRRRPRPAFEARVIATGIAATVTSSLVIGMALTGTADSAPAGQIGSTAGSDVAPSVSNAQNLPYVPIPPPPVTTSGGS